MSQQKILLVDNEASFLEILTECFGKEYTISTAVNGAEGLEKIKSEDPHLVITDIDMPVMNGLEMLEKIRASKDQRPVIVFTSYGDAKNISFAMKHRAFDFLAKTMNMDDMKKAVATAFEIIKLNVAGRPLETRIESSGLEKKFLHDFASPLSIALFHSQTILQELTSIIEKDPNNTKIEVVKKLVERSQTLVKSLNKAETVHKEFSFKVMNQKKGA